MRAAATRSAPAHTAHRTRLSSLRPRTTPTPGRVQLARVMKRQERARESAIEKGEDFFRLAAHGSLSEMEELLREGIMGLGSMNGCAWSLPFSHVWHRLTEGNHFSTITLVFS